MFAEVENGLTQMQVSENVEGRLTGPLNMIEAVQDLHGLGGSRTSLPTDCRTMMDSDTLGYAQTVRAAGWYQFDIGP